MKNRLTESCGHPAARRALGASLRACLVATLTMVAVGGCASSPSEGWSVGNVHDDRYSTIAIPMAANVSNDRPIGWELTEALVKQVEARTPWKVTPEGRADTILRVTITDVQLTLLSKNTRTGLAEEMSYRATANFEWSDLRSGETLVARRDFAVSGLFTPSRPAQEPIDLARFQVVDVMSRDIVDELQSEW